MDSTRTRRVRWAYPPILAATTEARRRLIGQLRAWGIPVRAPSRSCSSPTN